jgi:hypothetical protein
MAYQELELFVKSKDKEIAGALLYCLENRLEHMQAQLGYAKSLDTETVIVWSGGNRTERNRLEWVTDTESEIADCQAHIAEMEQILA